MDDAQIDLIISVGFIASNELINFDKYTKPSFAASIFDSELQHLPLKDNFPEINAFITEGKTAVEVSVVSAGDGAGKTITRLPQQTDAVIVLQLLKFDTPEIINLFNELNKREFNTNPGGKENNDISQTGTFLS